MGKVRLPRSERARVMREDRERRILDAALEEAKEQGYQWITRDRVAARAGVAAGSVNAAFGKTVELKRAVMRVAVERGVLEIVAQGLAEGSAIAQAATPEIKQQAAALLA